MVNDTTRLLGLDGLVADRVELHPDGSPVVHLSTGDEQARCCPQCRFRAVGVKQWTTTRPRDLPMAGRTARLRWRKRRWHCDQPGCPRKSFTEQVAQVPARARITVRLRLTAGAAVADGNRTIAQTARDLGLSWPIVAAAFAVHATTVLPVEPEPVTVLGIDEVRRRMTMTHRGRRGRASDQEWQQRSRLTRSAALMRAEHVDRLNDTLSNLPTKIGAPILAVWNAKEDLLDLLALARTRPDRETVARLLHRFYARCAATDLFELHRLATTIETWWPEIPAFLHTGITNAGSEGINRIIKPLPATPTDSATPRTNGYAPALPPPAVTTDTSTPLNFEEPLIHGRL